MEFNNYVLDLLVDDYKMGFFDDIFVLRWLVIGGYLFLSLYLKIEKKYWVFFFR